MIGRRARKRGCHDVTKAGNGWEDLLARPGVAQAEQPRQVGQLRRVFAGHRRIPNVRLPFGFPVGGDDQQRPLALPRRLEQLKEEAKRDRVSPLGVIQHENDGHRRRLLVRRVEDQAKRFEDLCLKLAKVRRGVRGRPGGRRPDQFTLRLAILPDEGPDVTRSRQPSERRDLGDALGHRRCDLPGGILVQLPKLSGSKDRSDVRLQVRPVVDQRAPIGDLITSLGHRPPQPPPEPGNTRGWPDAVLRKVRIHVKRASLVREGVRPVTLGAD